MQKNKSVQKARQLSAEGLQVVTKKARQLSWEGLQVVRKHQRISAEGLQVVPDSSLEVAEKYSQEETIPSKRQRRGKAWSRFLSAKFCGIRALWIVTTILIFVVGIAFGGAVVITIEGHENSSGGSGSRTIEGSTPATSTLPYTTRLNLSSSSTISQSETTTAVNSHSSQATTTVPTSVLSTTPTTATKTSTGPTSDIAVPSSVPDLTNLQTFTGALGGVAADPITSSGNTLHPYSVDGDTFLDYTSAVERSCDNQHIACADFANGSTNTASITTTQCDEQQTACITAGSNATQTTF